MRKEIVIAGSGGQGVQSLGSLLAKILDSKGYFVSLSFSYGPEARGGVSYSNIVIKDSPDDWPEIMQVDIMIALSQNGYNSCLNKTTPESIVIYDSDMVKPSSSLEKQYSVEAVKTATSLGSPIMTNMIMLGAMAPVTGIFSPDDVSKIFKEKISEEDPRLEYIKRGYNLAEARIESPENLKV